MTGGAADLIGTIVSNTYTTHDLERRLGVLRGCVEAALFTETELSYLEECTLYLGNQASEADAHAIKEWGEPVLTAFSQNNVGPLIKELQTAAEQLPTLMIYLPCTLPERELETIAQWCREERAPRTMLDVHIDVSVVGGCAFVSGDTYQEISFRSRIKDSPQLITHLLEAYARE